MDMVAGVQHVQIAVKFIIGAIYYVGSHRLWPCQSVGCAKCKFGQFIYHMVLRWYKPPVSGRMYIAGVKMAGSRSGAAVRWLRVLVRYMAEELMLYAANRWRCFQP